MSKSSTKVNGLEQKLENWLKDEGFCHYFAIQIKGEEVLPFGFANRPFYSLDQARTYLEQLQTTNPEVDYHLCFSGIDVDCVDFDNLEFPMWHRVWMNQHQVRLIKLRMWKKSEQELSKLIQNYDEVIAWQTANNTTEFCHYYYVQSCDDKSIAMSSSHTPDIFEALITKVCFEKTMPEREFKIERGLIHTDSILSMDGRTADFFQEFIDYHKERITNLDPEYLVNREIVTETRKVKR
ncbi:MAG: hypothetical protein GAK29_00907 [Acinetobacter bereziniae]|uniref:Uncharacterized protein n=1 Tax=Acinetobacter bereziniae TaxID=106648 RepID=A0A833U0E7_ACIBZ|nr:MAG: hypothetical protein GAK29_00907 [Acinetobacter bereziniae]